jgi:hypothetical protein
MKKEAFKDLYFRNNLMSEYDDAWKLLEELNGEFSDLDDFDEDVLDKAIKRLVESKRSTIENFVILMRYFKVAKRNDLYIHLTRYTGMLDVVDNIIKRIKNTVNEETYKDVIKGYVMPKLGMSPKELPGRIEDLMKRLDANLTDDLVKYVLTGNNHDVSEKSQLREKIEYEAAVDFKTYLKERHDRKVKELTECLTEGKVWFEQTITEDVIEHVKSNQEVLSAVLENDKLYITKIPYDTVSYLAATDEVTRKYMGCHCPFAREAIKEGNKLDERFCYCSAGFAKFPFEVILGQDLKIKTLETILGGSDICRFEIDLKGIDYKREKVAD